MDVAPHLVRKLLPSAGTTNKCKEAILTAAMESLPATQTMRKPRPGRKPWRKCWMPRRNRQKKRRWPRSSGVTASFSPLRILSFLSSEHWFSCPCPRTSNQNQWRKRSGITLPLDFVMAVAIRIPEFACVAFAVLLSAGLRMPVLQR